MTCESHIARALSGATWRASTYSGGQGNCVEVADGIPGVVPVRDSKRPTGPTAAFGHASWQAFVGHVRAQSES